MALDLDPTDPATWLVLMEMMVRYHERTGRSYRLPRAARLAQEWEAR